MALNCTSTNCIGTLLRENGAGFMSHTINYQRSAAVARMVQVEVEGENVVERRGEEGITILSTV